MVALACSHITSFRIQILVPVLASNLEWRRFLFEDIWEFTFLHHRKKILSWSIQITWNLSHLIGHCGIILFIEITHEEVKYICMNTIYQTRHPQQCAVTPLVLYIMLKYVIQDGLHVCTDLDSIQIHLSGWVIIFTVAHYRQVQKIFNWCSKILLLESIPCAPCIQLYIKFYKQMWIQH
jgi:hypothetical protein